MKKSIILFFTAFLFLSSTLTTEAKTSDKASYNTAIKYLDNELYVETELFIISENSTFLATPLSRASSSRKQKSASKVYRIKNYLGQTLATYTLHAQFTYNGSSSTCSKVSCSTAISNSAYYFSNKSASKSGNTAKGSFTLIRSFPKQTIKNNLSLKCSSTGKIS